MIEETKGYTLSVDTYKKAKSLKMKDPRYYIYASLRGSGMPMRDCWAIAFQGEGFNWPKDVLEREMNKLESLESVQTRTRAQMSFLLKSWQKLLPRSKFSKTWCWLSEKPSMDHLSGSR